MQQREAILSRIKKLLKHSESAQQLGNLEEAEAFALKANQLLIEYNLSLSDVHSFDDSSEEWKTYQYGEYISYKDNQSGQRWRLRLATILVTHNFCSLVNHYGSKEFRVYGKMENVDVVVWMYNFISYGLLRLAQEAHVQYKKQYDEQILRLFKNYDGNHTLKFPTMYNRYAFLKDFLLGAVEGISNKLNKQKEEMLKGNNNITALTIYNDKQLEKFINSSEPNLKKARKHKVVEVGFAYEDGLKAGEQFNITKPLASAKENKNFLK